MKKGVWGVLLLAGVLAGGCSSTGGKRGGEGEDGMGGATGGAYGALGLSAEQLREAQNRTIYFEYDQSEVPAQYHDLLRAHARLLLDDGMSVTVEGHADERGSREYNIALGERRADAVRRFLQAEGVAASQITTISYGEERPADPGSNESAWSLNRRAVVLY